MLCSAGFLLWIHTSWLPVDILSCSTAYQHSRGISAMGLKVCCSICNASCSSPNGNERFSAICKMLNNPYDHQVPTPYVGIHILILKFDAKIKMERPFHKTAPPDCYLAAIFIKYCCQICDQSQVPITVALCLKLLSFYGFSLLILYFSCWNTNSNICFLRP